MYPPTSRQHPLVPVTMVKPLCPILDMLLLFKMVTCVKLVRSNPRGDAVVVAVVGVENLGVEITTLLL